mmetsp:Transcript_18431/g.55572  ORF Transcript_18431/g.55572 Transcript_18431/m.55572 type:complete len:220 (+) Transcript_18431:1456-2115(+)
MPGGAVLLRGAHTSGGRQRGGGGGSLWTHPGALPDSQHPLQGVREGGRCGSGGGDCTRGGSCSLQGGCPCRRRRSQRAHHKRCGRPVAGRRSCSDGGRRVPGGQLVRTHFICGRPRRQGCPHRTAGAATADHSAAANPTGHRPGACEAARPGAPTGQAACHPQPHLPPLGRLGCQVIAILSYPVAEWSGAACLLNNAACGSYCILGFVIGSFMWPQNAA